MADDPESRSTILESVAPFLDDDTEDEMREMVDQMTGGDHAKLDEAVGVGISLAESAHDPQGGPLAQEQEEEPPHHVREVVNEDGDLIAFRVIVDQPPEEIDPFFRDDSMLLRTGMGDLIVPVPFEEWALADGWRDPADGTQTELMVEREVSDDGGDDDDDGNEE